MNSGCLLNWMPVFGAGLPSTNGSGRAVNAGPASSIATTTVWWSLLPATSPWTNRA
ncbi:hypothetical protein [Polyangium mundeleinium]|uniref:Uncharacterized protein n=1 Tax=Polyangium mundeleinium TaxID=2995306 RepID=A0ABT5F5C0_9BACT|nr:hypothetical protein [Polyangium mundeleinium]MDC0749286.1 hypothetical protein [Polyangium mundeleinium]